jgi:hypothetical protein
MSEISKQGLPEMSFREWLPVYEREQETHSTQIGQLTQNVGMLQSEIATVSANVSSLLENQRGLFTRINRPWQWGLVGTLFVAMLSIFGAFATILNLTVGPMKETLAEISHTSKERHEMQEAEIHGERDRQLAINMWMREFMEENRVAVGRNEEKMRWLEKIEERYNEAYGVHPHVRGEQ